MADWLCQNWQCPAKWSCRRFFGRSRAYWEMHERHPKLRTMAVTKADGSCDEYERDKVRPWLLSHAGQPVFPALDGSVARG